MRPLLAALFALLAALPAGAEPRQFWPLPELVKPTPWAVDGALKDMASGRVLKPLTGTPNAFVARVGLRGDTVYLGVEVSDDVVLAEDQLTVSVSFRNAGATAQGYVYLFGNDGKRVLGGEHLAPKFVQEQLQAAVVPGPKGSGLVLEIAVPARALPRFPAVGPIDLELCLTLEDRDVANGASSFSSNCKQNVLPDLLRLPPSFREATGLHPHQGVVAVESTETGWQGFDQLHHLAWVQTDHELDLAAVKQLFGGNFVDPASVEVNLPERLRLPSRQSLVGLLSGKNPYEAQGRCDPERELRLSLYLIKGKSVDRVLDWPAANCALGRAVSVAMDDEGALSIGYSNGAVVTFVWSTDHFERTEIGKR